MTPASVASIVFTVALLVVTAYFFLGSLPLLILKHDDPMDARFVRSFFGTYYTAAMGVAGFTALAYAVAGRPVLAIGAAAIALLAAASRRKMLPLMEALGTQIQSAQPAAVARFRRAHGVAIAINLAQLVLIVWALIALSPK